MTSYYDRPHALYRIYGESDHLLYIGCSPFPFDRIKCHESARAWATDMRTVRIEWFDNRNLARAAEAEAIKNERPEWNVHHNVTPKHSRGRYHHKFDRNDRSTWVIGPGERT